MKISLSWLRDLVDLPEDLSVVITTLDDLGLVVESVEHVGGGLEQVVVAEVKEIHAIEGADRIRRVVADAGDGSVEIVCGATNFAVGNFVPLAPVGAILPGGFEIAQRKMRGVTSNGMLCSRRELHLGDDHEGLMILDGTDGLRVGRHLIDLLGISPDVILEISPEGNRPDAWSAEGVARDLAARFELSVRQLELAATTSSATSSSYAAAQIQAPNLCGSLTIGVLRNVTVTSSPQWIRDRLARSGMRAVNNVVDASNYVMLELGQPTHPYDAALVSGRVLTVRAADPGEILITLDGETRVLGHPGRGLGDTGIDCVIVDGDNHVVGLAGIMGGSSSEITDATRDVLLEAAFFDPMTIARSSKRLGLRTEASSRFERGVDPTLAARAIARFVYLLSLSSPELEYLADPIVAAGQLPQRPTITVSSEQVLRLLGTPVAHSDSAKLLAAIGFDVSVEGDVMTVTAPAARLDIRSGIAGRADVIEEIARLYSYSRLARRTPTWVEPGALSSEQRFLRRVRETMVGFGFSEAWTASLISDEDFDVTTPTTLRVRITNPLAVDESIFRSSMLVGLGRAWSRNLERGLGDDAYFEIGTVVEHPGFSSEPRLSRGGVEGTGKVELPTERNVLTVLLARRDDDAVSATATCLVMAERFELNEIVVRRASAPRGWHPSRHAELTDRETGAIFGRVGELDPNLLRDLAPGAGGDQRVGLIEIDLGILAEHQKVRRRSALITLPSRFPAATIDLAFRVPDELNAQDLAHTLRHADELVEFVNLFDVYRGDTIGEGARSLAYAIRLSSLDHTLSESEIGSCRTRLIEAARALGAQLR